MNTILYADERGSNVSAQSLSDTPEGAPNEATSASDAAEVSNNSAAVGADATNADATNDTSVASTAVPPRPVALTVMFENIPDKLRALKQWVLWKFEWSPERSKYIKPGLQPNGHYARVNAPATWSSFEAVRAAYEGGNFDGIGIVLS